MPRPITCRDRSKANPNKKRYSVLGASLPYLTDRGHAQPAGGADQRCDGGRHIGDAGGHPVDRRRGDLVAVWLDIEKGGCDIGRPERYNSATVRTMRSGLLLLRALAGGSRCFVKRRGGVAIAARRTF
jgi:hypothetical protein